MVASDIITLLSCDDNTKDITMINTYEMGIEIFYTNEDTAYIEFSQEN